MSKMSPQTVKNKLGYHLLIGLSMVSFCILAITNLFSTTMYPELAQNEQAAAVKYSDETIDQSFSDQATELISRTTKANQATSGLMILMNAKNSKVNLIIDTSEKGRLAYMPWEPGSIMKPITIAAAIEDGTITKDSAYFESGKVQVGDRTFTNAIPVNSGIISITDILRHSLNTGAVHALQTLGNGSINKSSRNKFYKYLTENFHFGVNNNGAVDTIGYIPDPNNGTRLSERYAQMSFGIGLTASPLEFMSSYALLVNGGIYNQACNQNTCKEVPERVLSENTSSLMRKLLREALEANNPSAQASGYTIGGKSGTAPLANLDGYYYQGDDSGSYVGYISKGETDYILLVRFDNPKDQNFASDLAKITWSQVVKIITETNPGRMFH